MYNNFGRLGYNYGSGNVKQLKKTVRICFSFIAGISIFVFLFSLLGGESIAKVFAENNRNVFEITKNGFSIFSFSFLFSGCNIFSSALFTALSNGKVMERYRQPYLSCGHLDLLRCPFWYCRDF